MRNLRQHFIVLSILTIFYLLCIPLTNFAQESDALLSTVNGTVLLNGAETGQEAVVKTGAVLATQAGASTTVEFSDGSYVMLGENAELHLTTLQRTASGARISKVTLSQGWLQVVLSEGHQAAGSAFDIETPNALIGLTFSQPDVEVSYDPANEETIALARTVALSAKNLLSDEETLVPVGSTVIITALGVQVTSGIAAGGIAAGAITKSAGASATSGTIVSAATTSTATGIGTGTMVAIGAGAAAAAGGIAVLATQSDDGGTDDSGASDSGTGNGTDSDSDGRIDWVQPFTGLFQHEEIHSAADDCRTLDGSPGTFGPAHSLSSIDLLQNGNLLHGTYTETNESTCCTTSYTGSVNGRANGTDGTLTMPAYRDECQGTNCMCWAESSGATVRIEVLENGNLRMYFPAGAETETFADLIRH